MNDLYSTGEDATISPWSNFINIRQDVHSDVWKNGLSILQITRILFIPFNAWVGYQIELRDQRIYNELAPTKMPMLKMGQQWRRDDEASVLPNRMRTVVEAIYCSQLILNFHPKIILLVTENSIFVILQEVRG